MNYIKCISSGGGYSSSSKEILEFNFETEAWTVIGTMKEQRDQHAVTVESFDDYENWCN